MTMEYRFEAAIEIIGINPFVNIPNNILENIFKQAEKNRGAIPIKGAINDIPYKQTLVKYKGLWRLYVNTKMLKNSPKRIGEVVTLTITFDPDKRTIEAPPKLLIALENSVEARRNFEALSPSRKHEIIRYISSLKSEESIDRNIKKAIFFLEGKGRFVGRNSLSNE